MTEKEDADLRADVMELKAKVKELESRERISLSNIDGAFCVKYHIGGENDQVHR